MPRKGYKSITVKESVYSYFEKEWKECGEEYRLKYGITSFGGFMTKRLYELMEEEKRLRAQRDKKHNP